MNNLEIEKEVDAVVSECANELDNDYIGTTIRPYILAYALKKQAEIRKLNEVIDIALKTTTTAREFLDESQKHRATMEVLEKNKEDAYRGLLSELASALNDIAPPLSAAIYKFLNKVNPTDN